MITTTQTSHRVLSEPSDHGFALKNILVPVDLSPASENAWNYALRFAAKFGSRLTLLTVVNSPPVLDVSGISVAGFGSTVPPTTAAKNLRTWAATHLARNGQGKPGKIEYLVREGVPSHEIVEYAREAEIDLVVMATHGYTGWKHFCIGSTAERVVRAAPCPVLVVREKEHDLI